MLLYRLSGTPGGESAPLQPVQRDGWQQVGVSNPFSSGSHRGVSMTGNEPALITAFSLASTSLAGTQPDGDWSVDAQGQLRASYALRQRFDYYQSLVGEVPLTSIEKLVYVHASSNLKEPALSQVMALWRRYVDLQQVSWTHHVDLHRLESVQSVLTERQLARRHILGADWAQAFYSEEENQLQAIVLRRHPADQHPASSSETPAVQLHPQAAEREAAVSAHWQNWEQRLAAAKQHIKQLSSAPELSEPQRQQAIERYITDQFHGTELVRARILLRT